MPKPFPHHFEIETSWSGEGGSTISAGTRPKLVGGAPPEFDGRADWWSPEHLLLSALALCLQGTFDAIAGRAELSASSYRSRAKGTLEKTTQGIVFTSLELTVDLTVAAADVERAKEVLEKAKKHCIVANALKTETRLVANVTAG